MFIQLTNAGTDGTPVYIRAESISMIGVDNEGDTIVVYDGRTEFVKESPETVIDLIATADLERRLGNGKVLIDACYGDERIRDEE